jgi:hypothetical protein
MDVKSTWIYMASNGSCFVVTLTIFKNYLVEIDLNTKSGDHGTLNAHNRWFILLYHVWEPAWINIHWDWGCKAFGWGLGHIWLHTTTWGSVTTLRDFGECVGMATFGHFLLGSHNFMVMALGSCMKWASVSKRLLHTIRQDPTTYYCVSNSNWCRVTSLGYSILIWGIFL